MSLTKRWSEAGCLSQIVLAHALRQASVSLIVGVRQTQKIISRANRRLSTTMVDWNTIIFGKVVAKRRIKKYAHLFTLLSVIWSAFSLISVLLYRTPNDTTGKVVAISVWTMHLLFISAAVKFWMKEPESEIEIRNQGPE